MSIENTADYYNRNPEIVLIAGMSAGGLTNLIEGMEARGQRELVNSDRLPAKSHNEQAEFEALGFTFGDPDPADPLFRPATLPPGWARKGSDHSMGSSVVDDLGRERVSVFYKAAFYDRRADMYIVTPAGYLNGFLWGDDADAMPILDEVWLTPAVADETLAEIRDGHLESAARDEELIAGPGRTAENVAALRKIQQDERDRAAKAEALRLRVGGAA